MSDFVPLIADEPQELSSKKATDSAPDVILHTTDGAKIHAHRKVLARESSYFDAMFNSSFIEKDQKDINIQNISGSTLRLIIDLAYDHPLQLHSEELLLELLEKASMLQFLNIQKTCAELLQKNLSCSNAIPIFAAAQQNGIIDLAKCSFSLILSNFDQTAQFKEQFSELPEDLLLKILCHDNINCGGVEQEILILEIVNQWISDRNMSSIRGEAVKKFLSCARYDSFTGSDLETISTLPFILESENCSKVVRAIILTKRGVPVKPCKCECHTQARSTEDCQHCSNEKTINAEGLPAEESTADCCCNPCAASSCLFVFSHSKSTPSRENIESSSSFGDEKEKATEIANCSSPEVAELVGTLLALPPRSPPYVPCVVGHLRTVPTTGEDEQTSKRLKPTPEGPSLLVFDLKTRRFHPATQLAKVHEGPVEASGYKVCSLGKDVYVFGGEYMLGYGNWANTAWRFDSVKNSWSVETTLPSPRRHHSICVLNDFIYLIGGYGRHRIILDSVDRYDTGRMSWKRFPPLPSPTYSAACCAYNDIIYVFSHQVFAYNADKEADGEWKTLQNVAIPNVSFSQALSIKDHGVYLTSVYSNVLYYFNPDVCPCRFEPVGEFTSNILNSCYVETVNSIVTFSTRDIHGNSVNGGHSTEHLVEIFDLNTRTFSVVWRENAGSNFIVDFGIRHSLGCFSMLRYE